MRRTIRRSRGRLLSGLLALTLLATLLAIGWSGLLNGLSQVGWGIVWLLPLHAASDAADSLGWHALLAGQRRCPPRWYFACSACLRDAAGALLPVIGSAAPLLGAGLLVAWGLRWARACAATVAETSLSLVSQPLFVLVALALLLDHRPATTPLVHEVVPLAGVALLIAAIVLALQIRPLRLRPGSVARRLRTSLSPAFVHSPHQPLRQLHGGLRGIYRRPSRALRCLAWQLAGLTVGAAELALLFALLGRPIDPGLILLLQGLSRLTRSLAFMLPAGLGAQEGAFALVGIASGLGLGTGLSISLLLRCRDLLFGLPVLLAGLRHADRWWPGRGAPLPSMAVGTPVDRI